MFVGQTDLLFATNIPALQYCKHAFLIIVLTSDICTCTLAKTVIFNIDMILKYKVAVSFCEAIMNI